MKFLHYTSIVPHPFLLLIAANLAQAGYLGLKWSLWLVPPTKPVQAISSIFSPKIKLGPNWHQSTTKMAVARLRCNAEISEVFHIIILSYKVRKKTAMRCCNAKQVSTVHKLHFQPKNQLGPNWQQSTTKMDVAGLRFDA